ncbi:MAG: hypothetical protein ACLGIF_02085 [Actinomycetes bacterium]
MRNIVTTGIVGLATALTTGLLAFGSTQARADDEVAKREQDTADVVMTVEEDDDDSRERDTSTRSSDVNTGSSRSTRDHTNSRFTKVSRDRDLSRSDLTRDRTNDGKGKNNRDWSANTTNDGSRNDTRRR